MSSSYTYYTPYTPQYPNYHEEETATAYKISKTNNTLAQTYEFNKAYLDALQEQVAMQTNQTIDYELDHAWAQFDNLDQKQQDTLAKIQVSQSSGITAGNSKSLAVKRFLTKADTDKANLETNILNNLSSYADKQRKQMQDIWGREVMKWQEITTDMFTQEDIDYMMSNARFSDEMTNYQQTINDYNAQVQQYNMEIQRQQAEQSSMLGLGALALGIIF